MTEIQIRSLILMNSGYIINTYTTLRVNVPYYITVQKQSGVTTEYIHTPGADKMYIISSWGETNIPFGENVCFTISDEPSCTIPSCNFQMIGGSN